MDSRPLEIAVSAETIPSTAAGLSYFLTNTLRRMAEAEPAWTFRVIASSCFEDLQDLSPNIEVLFHDSSPIWRSPARLVRRIRSRGSVTSDEEPHPVSDPVVESPLYDWARNRWGNLKSLWKGLRGVDAIWASHYAISGSSYYSLLENAPMAAAPILFTLHDIHPVFFPDDWPEEALKRFWNELVPFTRLSTRIITHTRFQKNAIVDNLSLTPEKIVVVPAPPLVNPKPLVESAGAEKVDSVLERLGITRPYVLYPASNTHSHKNHMRLILAWRQLLDGLGEGCPMLVCTVKGHQWPAVKALIEALNLQEKIIFTDTVDLETLAALYHGCLFTVVPTLFEGGGSSPVAEAILAGRPVLCSRIPQIEEQLSNYGCGAVYFNPESVPDIVGTIETALRNLPQLERLAAREQQLLLSRVSGLWEELANRYTEQIKLLREN